MVHSSTNFQGGKTLGAFHIEYKVTYYVLLSKQNYTLILSGDEEIGMTTMILLLGSSTQV